MDVDVLRIFRYCKISGTVIKRRALKNLKPATGERSIIREKEEGVGTHVHCLYSYTRCHFLPRVQQRYH